MPRIEDYGLIGDGQSAALVSREGSVDWLCLPRFDSGACFAALLGEPRHGRWLIAPREEVRQVRRRYRDDTLVLETEFTTESGTARVIDFMPPRQTTPDLVRIVEGVAGRVPMRMELVIRCDYGSIIPWVHRQHGALHAIAGPDAFLISADAPMRGKDLTTVSSFEVAPGQRVPFVLTWYPSHLPAPESAKADTALEVTERWWREWAARCTYRGPWRDAVMRSLITLKALAYGPTGGIMAAPTTSLPEKIGGVRNWDYRFCWLRDATFTLDSLLAAGYPEEAVAWRDWLLRAVAGEPSMLQILYGPWGERRIPEAEIPWLPGYETSRPVRVGNAAVLQRQLDVYGEVIDTMHLVRRIQGDPHSTAWAFERALLEFLETAWREPDDGIWEPRGQSRHFTHSKVMAWVAFDRGVKAAQRFRLDAPVDRWRAARDEIHREVCARGYHPTRHAFVQSYDSERLDASLLRIPLVGFLPAGDARVRGTVEAIARELCDHGLVNRYLPADATEVDNLPPGEGTFLACSFWLADCYALLGRRQEARELFERLLTLRNDVGLLAEEYDPVAARQLGNFPQALSHVSLINTARSLSQPTPTLHRRCT